MEKDKLKKVLDDASKEKKLGFTVKSVKVGEEPTYGGTRKPEEKMPEWALVTMIVLGCLAFIFLVMVICVCVSKLDDSRGPLYQRLYESLQICF